MQERWRELLSQLSGELEKQSAKLRDLEYQNRQLLDTGMDSYLVHVCAASACFFFKYYIIINCLMFEYISLFGELADLEVILHTSRYMIEI